MAMQVKRAQVGANGGLIESLYQAGSAYQWGREIPVNSAEANATTVRFTVDYHTARERNIFRRAVVDNGVGIRANKFPDFINRIGAESKDPKFGGHQGIGMKVSSIGFNGYGVAVISRTPEDGQIVGILGRDATKEMGLISFDGYDENGNYWSDEQVLPTQVLYTDVRSGMVYDPQLDPATGLPLRDADGEQIGTDWEMVGNELFESIGNPESGVAVVMLGATGTEDTVLGDPSRDEATKYGLTSFLRRRFYTIPETLDIRVDEFRAFGAEVERRYSSYETFKSLAWPLRDKDESLVLNEDGTEYVSKAGNTQVRFGQGRAIKGLHERIYVTPAAGGKPAYRSCGVVPVTSSDGITCDVEWVITNHVRTGKDRGDENFGGLHGVIMGVGVAASKGIEEVLDIAEAGDSAARFSAYGIDHPTAVHQLFLLERPTVYQPANGSSQVPGVHMDMSRSGLKATSAHRVDASLEKVRREWGADFQNKMPREIKDLLEEAWADAVGSETEVDPKTLERIGEEMEGLLAIEALVADERGADLMIPTGRRKVRRGKGPRRPGPKPRPGEGDEVDTGPRPDDPKDPDSVPASPIKTPANLPRVQWLPGDNAIWQQAVKDAGKPDMIFVRLPDSTDANAHGTIILKGYAPGSKTADRGADWEDRESQIIRAAYLDAQADYQASKALLVEQKVKEAYEVCARTVVGHLLHSGGYDRHTKQWLPTGGRSPSFYRDLLESRVDLLSAILYGYYPQKRIAGGFLGAVTGKVAAAARRKVRTKKAPRVPKPAAA